MDYLVKNSPNFSLDLFGTCELSCSVMTCSGFGHCLSNCGTITCEDMTCDSFSDDV